jgi:hypothetical protein
MLPYEERLVAFDSHILTFFLDANRGAFRLAPDERLANERIAAFRLFLYCRPVIVPSVTDEATAISVAAKQEEQLRFIANNFMEFVPDDTQEWAIEARVAELLPHHPNGEPDCRVLAEVEVDGGVPVLVTFDCAFRRDLAPHTQIRLQSPAECWASLNVPRGTPPEWVPGNGHPLEHETWWRWE